MVGAGGVEFDGEPHAGAVGELVGVDAGVQALRPARGEDRAGLVAVEGALLAEHVDPTGVRGAGFEHLAGDQVDVGGGVVGEFRGDDVGAEEGDLVGVAGGYAQGAGLVGGGQAVAGLGLEGGGALPQRLGEVARETGLQFRVARGPGGGDGGPDAARAVGAAGHAGVELLGAVAREEQVGVGVHEAGEDRPAPGVDPVVSGGCFA